MNKSLMTNILALLVIAAGMLMTGDQKTLVLNTGLFALSGGVTNWLAVHMLFEKIPGIYGSGVIPERFEEFKSAIKDLIMEQFFNKENIAQFFSRMAPESEDKNGGIQKLIDSVDFNGAFDALVEVIMNSSFAGMLSMVGGAKALEPLQEPFVEKMKEFMSTVGNDSEVMDQFKHASTEALLNRVEEIVDHRLDELTPQIVKEIVQQMIQKHLGWLVVWGGVFGGLIGLLVTLLPLVLPMSN